VSITRWTVRKCGCGLLWPVSEAWCQNCMSNLFPASEIEVVEASNVRSTDPDTSKLAALKNEPRRGTQRARVLEEIERSGLDGLTAKQVEERSGLKGAWKRVSELKQGGHIVDIGERDGGTVFATARYFAVTSSLDARNGLFDE
jgi:hypothetical protein